MINLMNLIPIFLHTHKTYSISNYSVKILQKLCPTKMPAIQVLYKYTCTDTSNIYTSRKKQDLTKEVLVLNRYSLYGPHLIQAQEIRILSRRSAHLCDAYSNLTTGAARL